MGHSLPKTAAAPYRDMSLAAQSRLDAHADSIASAAHSCGTCMEHEERARAACGGMLECANWGSLSLAVIGGVSGLMALFEVTTRSIGAGHDRVSGVAAGGLATCVAGAVAASWLKSRPRREPRVPRERDEATDLTLTHLLSGWRCPSCLARKRQANLIVFAGVSVRLFAGSVAVVAVVVTVLLVVWCAAVLLGFALWRPAHA